MKTIKFIIPLITLMFISCEKFLEEVDYTNTNSETIFNSEAGFELMMNGAYVTLRALYGKENYWDLTVAGTDIYTFGYDNRSRPFCEYTGWNSGETPVRLTAIWRELYKTLKQFNLLLIKIYEGAFL